MNLLVSLSLLGFLGLAQSCSPPPGATNVAANGKASQSSDTSWGLDNAKAAIDGNKAQDYGSNSCTHTNQEKDPWWKLDLKQIYRVSTVVITNRADCCPERLMGAEVRIGNSPDNNNPVCGKVTSVSNPIIPFCCNGMEGQYVSVVIPGRPEYLTLCEVEVYGDLVTQENRVCW